MASRARRSRSALIPAKRRTPAELAVARARRQERRQLLPGPTTTAAKRAMRDTFRWIPDNAENRWLHNAALSVDADKRHDPRERNEYRAELAEKVRAAYRAAYNRQQSDRGKGRRRPTAKAAKAWTWVKRHRRRIRPRSTSS